MSRKMMVVLLFVAFMFSACAPAGSTPTAMMEKPTAMMPKPTDAMMEKPTAMMPKPTDAMMEKPTDAMMEKPTAMMPKPTDAMMAAPAWLGVTLTQVKNGQSFTLKDFKGKVVLVENMAMWCSNCKQQQIQIKALHSALGMNTDLVSVGLDIDPNEKAADLVSYTQSNGFDWIYAVAPAELTRDMSKLYGEQFLNPSAVPVVLIDRKGEVHPLPFGIKSVDALKKFIEPFLAEGK